MNYAKLKIPLIDTYFSWPQDADPNESRSLEDERFQGQLIHRIIWNILIRESRLNSNQIPDISEVYSWLGREENLPYLSHLDQRPNTEFTWWSELFDANNSISFRAPQRFTLIFGRYFEFARQVCFVAIRFKCN